MKCMKNEKRRIIPKEENNLWAVDQAGKVKRLSEKCLGERKEIFYQEKSERNEMKFALNLYIETQSLMDRELSRICRRPKNLNGSIEHLSSRQKLSRWIENLSRSY